MHVHRLCLNLVLGGSCCASILEDWSHFGYPVLILETIWCACAVKIELSPAEKAANVGLICTLCQQLECSCSWITLHWVVLTLFYRSDFYMQIADCLLFSLLSGWAAGTWQRVLRRSGPNTFGAKVKVQSRFALQARCDCWSLFVCSCAPLMMKLKFVCLLPSPVPSQWRFVLQMCLIQ